MPLSDYTGLDPFTPGATPISFGIWPTPKEANGNDTRSSGNSMAMGEALTSRTNFLGHRMIDIVSGGTYTFTTLITIKNSFVFDGNAIRFAAGYVQLDSGKTFYVGDPGNVLGLGSIRVARDSDITVSGVSSHHGKIIIDQFGDLDVENGGVLNIKSTGAINLTGTTRMNATQPAATADPGENNLLFSTAVTKAWGSIHFDGAGNATIDDGFNVASVAVTGAGNSFLVVTFARSMANATYHVSCSASPDVNGTSYHAQWQVRATGTVSFTVFTALNSNTPTNCLDLNATALTLTFEVTARQ